MKDESIRCSPYPSVLMEDVDDNDVLCRVCGLAGQDVREILEHIRLEHPVEEISCKKCKSRTRLEGTEYCDECEDDTKEETTQEETMKQKRKYTKRSENWKLKGARKLALTPENRRTYAEITTIEYETINGGKIRIELMDGKVLAVEL